MPPDISTSERIAGHRAGSRRNASAPRRKHAEPGDTPIDRSRPFDFRWFDSDFAALVRDEKLDDLDALFERRDLKPVVAGNRGRETLRLAVRRGERIHRFYLKRERGTRWKDLLGHLAAGRGFWTKARAEFEALRQLTALGIMVPRPILCLQRGVGKPRACLLLEEMRNTALLGTYLAAGQFHADRARRDRFFTVLGREVARLHATGFNQPDLYSMHVHVAEDRGGWKIAFLNFQRSVRHRRLTLEQRIRDLSALLATLPARLADPRDREMFYDAYLGASELEDRAAQVIAGVGRRSERLLKRRKIWEIRENDAGLVPSISQLESLETGKMWIDGEFRPHLESAGLSNFEAMMNTTDGEQLRALADRENWRLEFRDTQGTFRAYLKKHHFRNKATRLRAWMRLGPHDTPGRVEARNVARLERGGIAAMRLVAFGEKLHSDGLLESFVLTEELCGFTQLDHFLRQRFGQHQAGGSKEHESDLARLIREVARVASKFHQLGYNHRDLYCCHFFIKEPQSGRFQVNLIDLQRVEHRRKWRRRWLVKDLAQLAYSAPRDRINCTDRLAFMKHYLGVSKLRPKDKRLIREVLAKQRIMERQLGMHP